MLALILEVLRLLATIVLPHGQVAPKRGFSSTLLSNSYKHIGPLEDLPTP